MWISYLFEVSTFVLNDCICPQVKMIAQNKQNARPHLKESTSEIACIAYVASVLTGIERLGKLVYTLNIRCHAQTTCENLFL